MYGATETKDLSFRQVHPEDGGRIYRHDMRALQAEDKIGTMLPCNVIVQQHADGSVEVSAVDPVASMAAVVNAELAGVAEEIRNRLRAVIDAM